MFLGIMYLGLYAALEPYLSVTNLLSDDFQVSFKTQSCHVFRVSQQCALTQVPFCNKLYLSSCKVIPIHRIQLRKSVPVIQVKSFLRLNNNYSIACTKTRNRDQQPGTRQINKTKRKNIYFLQIRVRSILLFNFNNSQFTGPVSFPSVPICSGVPVFRYRTYRIHLIRDPIQVGFL